MSLKVPSGQFDCGVGIAVHTAMRTRIVGPDIFALHTSAKLTLALVLCDGEVQSEKAVKQGVINALSMADTPVFQVEGLSAGKHFEAIISPYLGEDAGEFAGIPVMAVNIDDPDPFLPLSDYSE